MLSRDTEDGSISRDMVQSLEFVNNSDDISCRAFQPIMDQGRNSDYPEDLGHFVWNIRRMDPSSEGVFGGMPALASKTISRGLVITKKHIALLVTICW